MNLDVLKTTLRVSKWRDSTGSMALNFQVVPQGDQYIEIGDKYLFSASSYARFRDKERTLVAASVTVSANAELLGNLQGLFAKEQVICGSANFYPERHGSLDFDPAQLFFDVVVEPQLFAEMVRTEEHGPGGATLSIGLEGLEFGWEPDASHLIWELEGDAKATDRRPITSFGYHVERFCTSEAAIKEEADKRLNAELADSPDPKARELAAQSAADRPPDPMMELLKQCRLALWVLVALAAVSVLIR